jgi:hypothetical protein
MVPPITASLAGYSINWDGLSRNASFGHVEADTLFAHEFATRVGKIEYLNYLYLLTVADIRATNIWNRSYCMRATILLKLGRYAARTP